MLEFGEDREKRYWAIFEQLRAELGYADYLGALQRYRAENPRDPHFLQLSSFLVDYPFADRLYPGALPVYRVSRQSSQLGKELAAGNPGGARRRAPWGLMKSR